MDKLTAIPKFANEAEEAEWWFNHPEAITQEFDRAEAEGRIGIGLARRRAEGLTPTTTIRLDPTDIAKARELAAKKGLKYQTYLKMLIHEALERESAA